MTPLSFWDICTEKGWRADPAAGTADGVAEGVAFRVFIPAHSLLLSVSLPEKALPRLQSKLLSPDFPLGAVAATTDGSGVHITPDTFPEDPARLADWIVFCIHTAAAVIDTAYTDKHISGTDEPVKVYISGIAGAALGALVGIIPWVLTGFLGWQFWLLGGLVGIASFYGYQLFRGAHRTGFALAAILITSLIAVLGCEIVSGVYQNWVLAADFREDPEYYGMLYEEYGDYYEPLTKEDLTLSDVIAFTLSGAELVNVLSNSLYGLAVCGVGVFFMKGRIQEYTHSSTFLRSRRFR